MEGTTRSQANPQAWRRAHPRREALARDEQALLAASVQRLRDAARVELVEAWALRPDGAPYLAAAAFEGAAPEPPDRDAFAAATALPGATAITRQSAPPALACVVAARPEAAVAPVGEGPEAIAVLVLGSRKPLRPRSLAMLDAAARRLRSPLAAARAARRLAEVDADVRRLDRLAALGALAAEMAHEVRNPLVSVKTFLQLLPERGSDPEFTTRFLEVATEELGRVERLLDLVVAYPGGGDSEVAQASVPRAVATVAELLAPPASARGVKLDTEIEPGLPPVAAGPDALRQMLLNLGLNALEASPEGGEITIEVSAAASGVDFAVSDDGPGIPAADRQRIFDAFTSIRRSEHGGGLGLSITRRLAEEAGGHITAEPAPGRGARLRLHLPRA